MSCPFGVQPSSPGLGTWHCTQCWHCTAASKGEVHPSEVLLEHFQGLLPRTREQSGKPGWSTGKQRRQESKPPFSAEFYWVQEGGREGYPLNDNVTMFRTSRIPQQTSDQNLYTQKLQKHNVSTWLTIYNYWKYQFRLTTKFPKIISQLSMITQGCYIGPIKPCPLPTGWPTLLKPSHNFMLMW